MQQYPSLFLIRKSIWLSRPNRPLFAPIHQILGGSELYILELALGSLAHLRVASGKLGHLFPYQTAVPSLPFPSLLLLSPNQRTTLIPTEGGVVIQRALRPSASLPQLRPVRQLQSQFREILSPVASRACAHAGPGM